MGFDHEVARVARRQLGLFTRDDVKRLGGSDAVISHRIHAGMWAQVQVGVYSSALSSLGWDQRLLAACLAGGEGAVASHRAAAKVWQLDGVSASPLEITVPYGSRPEPCGVLVHRTRRPPEVHEVGGIPVTGVERTLIDLGRFVPNVLIERGLEDGIKRHLTTVQQVRSVIELQGGRGVPGAHRVRGIIQRRGAGPAAGSPAEVMFLRALRRHGVADPIRQHPIPLPDGSLVIVDFAWPQAMLAIEFDGMKKRWDQRALDAFLERQNAILDQGWRLRRYGWIALTQRPEDTARRIAGLLAVP